MAKLPHFRIIIEAVVLQNPDGSAFCIITDI